MDVTNEPLSPELVLVDPELGARARASLPYPAPAPRRPRSPAAPPAPAAPRDETSHRRPYPFWARVTAALWLIVIGILVGGAAIPHAQDQPRIVTPEDDAPTAICEAPSTQGPRPRTQIPVPGGAVDRR